MKHFLSSIVILFAIGHAHGAIDLMVKETQTGVEFLYTGTWDVGQPDGSTTMQSSTQPNLYVDSSGIAFSALGSSDGFGYAYVPLVMEVTPVGTLPTLTYPGTDLDLTGTILTGTQGSGSFALDLYDDGTVSLYGKSDAFTSSGWSANDAVNGSIFFAGQSLASIGMIEGIGSFAVAGQTVDWSITSVPEPSSGALWAAACCLISALGFNRSRR